MIDFCNQVTIIIITNREFPIARAAEYYSAWGCRVIICDSSEEVNTINKYSSIEHIHYPNDLPFTKITKVLKLVKTPFVCLSADDDFLSLKGVLTGIRFLLENKDYVSVQGKYIQFTKVNNYVKCVPMYAKADGMKIVSEIPKERIITSARYGMQHIYSLHRTEVLQSVFSICGDINNSAYFEYNSNIVGMFYGKHIMLPIFWMARDSERYTNNEYYPRDLEGRNKYLTEIKNFLFYDQKGKKYKDDFSRLYSIVTGDSVLIGNEIFDHVFSNIYFQELKYVTKDKKFSLNSMLVFIKSLLPESLLRFRRKYTDIFPFRGDQEILKEWKIIESLIFKHVKY